MNGLGQRPNAHPWTIACSRAPAFLRALAVAPPPHDRPCILHTFEHRPGCCVHTMSSRSLATPTSKPAGGVCAAASHNEVPNDGTVEVTACSSSSCSSVTAACMEGQTARDSGTPLAGSPSKRAGSPTDSASWRRVSRWRTHASACCVGVPVDRQTDRRIDSQLCGPRGSTFLLHLSQ